MRSTAISFPSRTMPDPLADSLDLVELMRGDEDGAAPFALLGDEGEELLLHQRVEAAGRLVEDQQLWLVGKVARISPTFWRLPRESCPRGRSRSA
jgi:hypothetical protein